MRVLFVLFGILSFTACSQAEKEIEREIEIELKIAMAPQKASYRGISVLSEKLAWMSGSKGSIIRTADGGDNWSLLNPPDSDSLDYRDVHAYSETEAIVLSAGYPSRIYRTANGGVSWSLVHENLDSVAFMNSIHFSSASDGSVFGDVLDGYHLILQTSDSGKTWSRVDSVNLPKPLEVENGFAASGSCIAFLPELGYVIALGGEQVRIFHSTNGLTWSAHETPMFAGSSSRGAYSIASGKASFMAVGGDYLEADSARLPIHSTDGQNWEVCKGKLAGYRSVIAYSKPLNFWVAGGSNGIEFSSNQGVTWNNVADASLNTLQFAPDSPIAFGANGKGELFKLHIIEF